MTIERDQIRTLAVLAVLAAGFVFGLWLPQRNARAELRQQVAGYEKELGLNQQNTEGLAQLNENVIQLRLAKNTADKDVPATEDVSSLWRQIDLILQEEKVEEPEIRARPVQIWRDYKTIPLNIEFQGSFQSTFGFIDKLENMRRLVRINELEISGKPHQKNPLRVEINLDTFAAVSEEASR